MNAAAPTCWLDWRPGTDPVTLSEHLFAGRLVRFPATGPLREIGDRARAVIADFFGTDDPHGAEGRHPPDAFRRLVIRARKAVQEDNAIMASWRAQLDLLRLPADELHQDRLRLRIVPSHREVDSRTGRPLPPHRDSWGSGVAAQVNWWLPLYPLDPARTMRLWPELFATPVPNTSASWDYDELMSGHDKTYPLLPVAEAPPPSSGLPVMIEPGELLAFSAAQLHASCTDASGITRFSLDTRTVWTRDVEAGRGAPDVDGSGKPPRWGMFDRPVRAGDCEE